MSTLKLMKPVRVELLAETHRRLRMAAAENDQSMSAYARDVLSAHLAGEPEDWTSRRKGAK